MENIRIIFYFPLPSDNIGISYLCFMFAYHMRLHGHDVSVITPRCQGKAIKYKMICIESVPKILSFLPYRYFGWFFRYLTERKFISEINKGDIAYLWSKVSIGFVENLKSKGVILVREKFNSHVGFVKNILDKEYKSLSIIPDHDITEKKIKEENIIMELIDYVFSANPEQRKTLIEYGVNAGKIISSSYGWDPERFKDNKPLLQDNRNITFIYVGSGIVRKGLHLLLTAWVKAGVNGNLIIAGRIHPFIKNKYANILNMSNIYCYDYTEDIGKLYKLSDVFVFPTLEEGGPLVTYEAMANSLAVIVSPMGAGAIARDNVDGFIIEPHDIDGMVDSLKKMSSDINTLNKFKINAFERSKEFTFDKVAKQRIDELLNKVNIR